MAKSIFLLVSLFAFAPPSHAKPTVFFVPGYYGTKLVEPKTGDTVWLSVSELLFGSERLSLCHRGLAPIGCRSLVPGSIMDEVAVVPWIYAVDFYGGPLRKLRESVEPEFHFEVFLYDWRNAAADSAKLLYEKVQSKGEPAYIIGHSFGGMVAYRLLELLASQNQSGKKPLRGVAMIGAPFRGAARVLHNLIEGRTAQGTDTLLDPVAFGTFPSAYDLLPSRPGILLNETGEDASDLLELPKTWGANGWGIFAAQLDNARLGTNFVLHQLQRRRRYVANLAKPLSLESRPEILNFRSRSLTAPHGVGWDFPRKRLSETNHVRRKGDGTVTWTSAAPPDRIAHLVVDDVELSEEHLEMISETRLLQRLRRHLDTLFSKNH